MSKILLLLLISCILSKPNFLSFADSSEIIASTQMSQTATYSNSIKWVGFDLSSPHIITKISWSNSGLTSSDIMFGLFEGANEPNFIDAVPLYMFKDQISTNYIEIESTASFRYVRYASPLKKTVSISDIEIYGYEAESTNNGKMYQPTNIPLIVVNTEGKINLKSKSDSVDCNVIIISEGIINVKETGNIRIRGNSSKDLEKKSYQINLDQKTTILDMPAKAKKWGLLANHMDKSLIRNLVAFKISSLLGQKYSPACRSADLIIDGSFEGNYIICDKIERGEGRVELDEMDQSCNEAPCITGGYLMEIDGFADQETYHFNSKKGVKVTIKYPDTTSQQTAYLKSWFDELEQNIYDNQNVDNIDLETFSQYFILNEFCADIDSVWSSYYVTKQRNDDKLHFGPAWDFDLSLDNDNRLYPTNSKEKWIFNFGLSAGTFRQFISKLMSCEKTLTAVQNKWKEVTASDFTKDVIFRFIEDQINYIDESQKLNFKRWDVLNKILQYEAVARGSYEAEIEHLKEYIEERFMVFGNMLLNANTMSFEVQEESFFPVWNPGDWGDWQWPTGGDNNGQNWPWGGNGINGNNGNDNNGQNWPTWNNGNNGNNNNDQNWPSWDNGNNGNNNNGQNWPLNN